VSNTNKKTSKASEEAQQEKLSAEVVPIAASRASKDFTISDTATSAAHTTTESTAQASAKNTAALETTTSTGSKFTESTAASQGTTAESATTAAYSSTSASSHSNTSNTKVETIQNDISVGKTATVDKKNLWCSDDDSDSDDDSRMVITNHKPMSGSATSLYEDSDEDAVYIDTTKKQIPNKNNVTLKVNTNIPIVHIQPSVADNTTSTNEPTNLEFTIDNLPDIGSLAFPT
jgi:hypothetical protein